MVKNLPANAGDMSSIPRSWEDLLEKDVATPIFLPGKSHGQRSLLVYSPWGPKESAEEQTPGGLSMKVCYTCTLTN